ncbi:MAG: conjugative transfer signal peptidase TraF [Candidatus Margulisbacteria bacterium]|nr:conjugative transfer signal peptidase TraF [Candidatus Margulisiibacteriota bacterium]
MKNKFTQNVLMWILLIVFVFLLLGLALGFLGYRVNLSHSYPIGIWKITSRFDPKTDKGKIVLICISNKEVSNMAQERGYIRAGVYGHKPQPILKRVMGLSGDNITVSKEGVSINDFLIPNSKLLSIDSGGRNLERANSTMLEKGHVWVMSEYHPRSFDSRYFGPLLLADISGVIDPVWVVK